MTVRRYRCTGCGHVWRQDTSRGRGAAGEAVPRRGLRWALDGAGASSTSPSLGSPRASAVSWNTANDAVLAEGQRVLIDDPARFDGVQVIGVDEHVVRHEALLFRMEVRDLHRLVVVAAG